jgi:peptide methionine sulfoxide reductase msrA/msrB
MKLTPFEHHVIKEQGTEAPNTGLYTDTETPGVYCCKACDAELYKSEHKFLSHCGWPSFDDEIPQAVKRLPDPDGRRVEIRCAACDAHLGHVFKGEGLTPRNTRHCVNSVSMVLKPKMQDHYKKAVFASGCFWGTEYYMARVPGVIATRSGYTGGQKPNPTYKEVCTGKTGHVEAVEVLYDPNKVSYEALAKVFFETHDFTQTDGQGPDRGSQYLSVAFYSDDQERKVLENLSSQLNSKGYKVATALQPRVEFFAAEPEHQLYYERQGEQPYCHRYKKIF